MGTGRRQPAKHSERRRDLALREGCQSQRIAMMVDQRTRRAYLFLPQRDEVACRGCRVARSRAGALGMRRSIQFNHPHL